MIKNDENVSLAEAITAASNIHAIYNDSEVNEETASGIRNLRYDFDTMDGISLYNSTAQAKDGILTLTATQKANGGYDPGFYLDNLNFYSTDYDTIKIRMKRDALYTGSKPEVLQFYFKTLNDVNYNASRGVTVNLKTAIGLEKLSDWFVVEAKLSDNELWQNTISAMRIDPTDNNGIYYIDYVEFSKSSEENINEKWYDLYVKYAITHGIIGKETYSADDYTRNVTRAEMCNLFAAALPEEYFTPINNVNSIPDMDKNDYYADIMLMLYRAGVVFGDDEGNFYPESDVKRSEAAAIINRIANEENRIVGEISEEWKSPYYIHDIEFHNTSELDTLYLPSSSSLGEIVDGHLVLIPVERASAPTYDPQVGKLDTNIVAEEYTTLRVRMKVEYEGEVERTKGEFFFKPEGVEKFSEAYGLFPDFEEGYYVDAAGWRVYNFYLGGVESWKGDITAFRFDPTNNNGVYTIDYIRFIRDESSIIVPDEELERSYVSRRLFEDEGFEEGFVVYEPGANKEAVGTWTYGEEGKEPKWNLLPWWTNSCFINDAAETGDDYTIADNGGTKSVTYIPGDKSVVMRLNSDKVYNGEAHVEGEMWPHLLLEQELYDEDYSKVPDDKKEKLDLGADKVYVEMEVKLRDLVDLDKENREGGARSHIKYNVYFYVAHKDVPGLHTYFGVNPLDTRGNNSTKYDWFPDIGILWIYRVPAIDFVNEENALGNDDGTYNMNEWKKVRVDITPHLENVASLLTRDNILKRSVTRDDFWLSGANIGFEIWGNYQCEVEVKNFNVICYDKIEE